MKSPLILLIFVFIGQNMGQTTIDDSIEGLLQWSEPESDAMTDESKDEKFVGLIGIHQNKVLMTLWVFSLYLIVASLVKMWYEQSNFLTTNIPEPAILIMIGICFGTIIKLFEIQDRMPKFTVDLFFFILLPPIILEAAFTLHNEYFFDNLITILMYAVIGTLINVFCIGLGLYLVGKLPMAKYLGYPNMTLIELLIFANAISAVDPVTVLTIFKDLRVNKSLHYLVFGESLLNDAVVIVMHSLLDIFLSSPLITSKDMITGLLSFFLTSIGGLFVGLLFGAGTAFITKYTKQSLIIEPMIVIGMAYCSYLTADLITWSGLISLIGCGLMQYEFAFKNISKNTQKVVKYFTQTLSSVCDLLIFFFLGQMLMNDIHEWNNAFILATIIFCLIFRTLSVSSLTHVSNTYFHRSRKINWEEQALMIYGGLRGAVAFAMMALLETNEDIEHYSLLKTTTFVIILFSVFFLGGTTKPVLDFLAIQRESADTKSLSYKVNELVIPIVINGIDILVGSPSAMNQFKNYINDQLRGWRKYLYNPPKNGDQFKQFKKETKHQTKATEAPETKLELKIANSDETIEKIDHFILKLSSVEEQDQNIVSDILDKNKRKIFKMEKIRRKHTLPKIFSAIVIKANHDFKPTEKLFGLRSDLFKNEFRQRFNRNIPKPVPETHAPHNVPDDKKTVQTKKADK